MPPSLNRPIPWILGLVLIVFVVSLCFNPAECNDLFWQIRTGHDIAVTGHAPHSDTFSWTRYGTPWIAHEWLCFLLMWKLMQIGGFSAIWIAESAMVALTFIVVYIHILRETEGSPITSFLLALSAAIVSCGFFQPRPHLWTYLFLAITIATIMRLRKPDASWKNSWLLLIVFLIWSNVHAGVIVGVGMVFAFAIGDALQAWSSPAERGDLLARAKRTALLGIACAATTFFTPYSWHIYENMGATLGNTTMLNIVSEWASPNFHDADGKVLEVFLGLLAYGVAFTRRKREWAPILILILLVHEALAASRNVPLLAVAGMMLISPDIYSGIKRHLLTSRDAGASLFAASPTLVSVIAVAVAIVAASAMRSASALQNIGYPHEPLAPRIATASYQLGSFPSAACRFMEAEQFPASVKIYNIYDIGGYLIWRLPQYPVFVDGRADVYFGKTLEDTNKIYSLPYNWRSLMDSYGVDVIFTTATQNQTKIYLDAPDWALVYADRAALAGSPKSKSTKVNALIFVKRLPKYSALIARCRRDCPAISQMQATPAPCNYAALQ
ncbi:hypothetical protein CCAX7_48580 [Capsulimonas corticalis]|uniref:Uncharacterized protein n=1 Tax=Capsulimonas corticalis TaxID=2219043 RepID=A0A402CPU2_9BACT|nr:hypothetical protein [Capsulimonas corticalis]BDI32807.1 hypothetical protein CCAX7_48580 [Capsulimonas corticalis]